MNSDLLSGKPPFATNKSFPRSHATTPDAERKNTEGQHNYRRYGLMNIAVSVTPELVQIERQSARSLANSAQTGPLGPSAAVRE